MWPRVPVFPHALEPRRLRMCARMCCAAGLTIAEFSTIGRIFASYTEVGFASLVIAKHTLAIFTTWGVPRVLAACKAAQGLSTPWLEYVLEGFFDF